MYNTFSAFIILTATAKIVPLYNSCMTDLLNVIVNLIIFEVTSSVKSSSLCGIGTHALTINNSVQQNSKLLQVISVCRHLIMLHDFAVLGF